LASQWIPEVGIGGHISPVQVGDAYRACFLDLAGLIFSFMTAFIASAMFALKWIARGLL
jgi:hypothetical protein